MPRLKVPSRSFAWPRVAVLALAGVAVAGCESSSPLRLQSIRLQSAAAPRDHWLDFAAFRFERRRRVATAAGAEPVRDGPANGGYGNGGYASGAHGLAAYRPGASDVTGSVPAHPAPPPVPAGHWTWDGGQPVTVGQGETLEAVARKNGVPLSALMEVNGITNVASIRPGQRLVIPRYVSGTTAQASARSRRRQRRSPKMFMSLVPGES